VTTKQNEISRVLIAHQIRPTPDSDFTGSNPFTTVPKPNKPPPKAHHASKSATIEGGNNI
jgi:hypothetical protein